MPHDKELSVCILGCGGFIGSHLIERILSGTRWRITGADLSSAKIEPLLNHPRFLFHKVNVSYEQLLAPLVHESNVVVSLASLCNPSLYNTIPIEVIESNFIQQIALVKLCAQKGKRLIQFSTSEVYGKTAPGLCGQEMNDSPRWLLKEDASPLILGPVNAQRWSYAAAKQLLERLIYAYGAESGLDYTIVRPFNFIGPRMDFLPGVDGSGIPRVLACFMEALLCAKPLLLVDGGNNQRVFTAIYDAIEAIIAIIERPEVCRQQIINIGHPGNEVTIAELARMMIDLYRKKYPHFAKVDFGPVPVSSDEFYGKGYEDSDRRLPDITKARELLEWSPIIPLKEALSMSMDWFVFEYANRHSPTPEKLVH